MVLPLATHTAHSSIHPSLQAPPPHPSMALTPWTSMATMTAATAMTRTPVAASAAAAAAATSTIDDHRGSGSSSSSSPSSARRRRTHRDDDHAGGGGDDDEGEADAIADWDDAAQNMEIMTTTTERPSWRIYCGRGTRRRGG